MFQIYDFYKDITFVEARQYLSLLQTKSISIKFSSKTSVPLDIAIQERNSKGNDHNLKQNHPQMFKL